MFSVFQQQQKKVFCRKVSFAVVPLILAGLFFASCDSPVGPGTNPGDLIDAATPTITTQPSGGRFYIGTAETFPLTVSATSPDGGTLSYQWYSNTSNSTTGGSIMTGRTAAAITLNKTEYTANGNHYFYVVVTNTNNNATGSKIARATSNVVTVYINGVGGIYLEDADEPEITTQPQGGTFDVGTNETFVLTVEAEIFDDGVLTYQWYSTNSGTNTSGGSVIAGKTTATLTLNKTDYTTNGSYHFYVIVTNTIEDNHDGGIKTASTASNVATVNVNGVGGNYFVNAEEPSITTEPAVSTNWNVSTTNSVNLTVVANSSDGGTLSYQWYSTDSNTNTTSGSTINGKTAATLTLNKTDYTANGSYYFYVIVTNTITDDGLGGNKSAHATSTVATVNVTGNAITPPATAIPLVEGQWKDGNITGGIDRYSFTAIQGTAYSIWWNDDGDGDDTKTGDIEVRAQYSDGTEIFDWEDDGYTVPQSFTASKNDTVFVDVSLCLNDNEFAGTYSIKYALPTPQSITFSGVTAGPNNLPDTTVLTLTFDKPIPGFIAGDITLSGVSGVSKGTLGGNGPVYTLPIAAPGGGTLSVAVAKAPHTISGSSQTVAITGGNAVPLIENQWMDGDVPNASDIDWYTISVTNGTNYYFWWNDDGEGNETKTGDIDVIAYYSDGSELSGWDRAVDHGWDNPKSFTAARTGTVYVRARPYNNTAGLGYEGTYGIVYSTINMRPNIRNPGDIPVTFSSVSPVGSPGTTALTLTFSEAITGLSANDITLLGIFNVTKGTLSGDGPVYTLPISGFPLGGSLTVMVAKAGYYISDYAKTVTIVSGITVTPLVAGQWKDGEVRNASGIDWYSISVSNGMTYYIWWNDKGDGEGDNTKTGDIDVIAYYSDGSGISGWSSAQDAAWVVARSFTATRTGIVLVRVRPFNAQELRVGTYGIGYNTINLRPGSDPGALPDTSPLSDGVWRNGELTTIIRSIEYPFAVENGKTYYVWWNNSYAGPTPNNKTLDTRASARYSDETAYIFGGTGSSGVNSGWVTPQIINADRTGTVNVIITPYTATANGTFAVAFSTVSLRPGAAVPKTVTANQWADETISLDDIHVYTINVTQDQTYNVWWNETGNGDGSKIANVEVQARYADDTLIFNNVTGYANQWVNAAWTSPQTFTATRTGTVDLRVRPFNENIGSVGSYGIAYSTGSTMPVKDSATLSTVTANGSPGTPTTALTLTFDKVIPGLSAADIALSGIPNVTKGDLSNSGPVYTLQVTVTLSGTLTVTVGGALLQIAGSPKTVPIYGNTNVTPLVANQWADGTITSGSNDWYSFTASAGTTYYVWWNGGYTGFGDGNKTGDTKVSAYYASGTSIFTDVNQGWTNPQSIIITAATAGTVFVKVMPFNTGASCTYGVVYSTINSRPIIINPDDIPVTLSSVSSVGTPTSALTLTFSEAITDLSAADITLTITNPGLFGVIKKTLSGNGPVYTLGLSAPSGGTVTVVVEKRGYNITGSPATVNVTADSGAGIPALVAGTWTNGDLTTGGSVDWHRITVTAGTTYRIWWNDSDQGNGTKTGDVAVSAWNVTGTNIFGGSGYGGGEDRGWDNPQSITPAENGAVFVKVIPYSSGSGHTGTYGIVFTANSETKPAVP
jgi:hypothetical protein